MDDDSIDALTRQQTSHIGIDSRDIAILLTTFRQVGFWRSDIDEGLFYWSEDLFKMFDMGFTVGPVSLATALDKVHPDDRDMVARGLEQAACGTAFDQIFRVRRRTDAYHHVRSIGRHTYRDGRAVLLGMCHELLLPVPHDRTRRSVDAIIQQALHPSEDDDLPPSMTR